MLRSIYQSTHPPSFPPPQPRRGHAIPRPHHRTKRTHRNIQHNTAQCTPPSTLSLQIQIPQSNLIIYIRQPSHLMPMTPSRLQKHHYAPPLPLPPSTSIHLPLFPRIRLQHRSRPPLAVRVAPGAVEKAVLSPRDGVHPGARFGELPPLSESASACLFDSRCYRFGWKFGGRAGVGLPPGARRIWRGCRIASRERKGGKKKKGRRT